MTECERCGKKFEGPDTASFAPEKHGWPVNTGEKDKETRAEKWVVLRCADASPEQIVEYKKAVEILKKRAEGIAAKGPGFKKVE